MTPFDVAIVGSGLLGSALSAEAAALGLRAVCVGPAAPSPSLAAGSHFRLNTWARPGRPERTPSVAGDQHPRLSGRLADGSPFPLAQHLATAAREVLEECAVARRLGLVEDLTWRGGLVRLKVRKETLSARAAILALGWGRPRVPLARPEPVRRALRAGEHAFDFSGALTALAEGRLRHARLAVVGAGPSALSFLEACLGLGPSPGLALSPGQSVLWLQGPPAPPNAPGVKKMFQARYRALERRLALGAPVHGLPRMLTAARRRGGAWRLTDDTGAHHLADALAWCAGFEPPLALLEAHARSVQPFLQRGVKLALQRHAARGPVPIFQVGPALDQLGLGDWDTGPFSEWFEKGRRLLRVVGGR